MFQIYPCNQSCTDTFRNSRTLRRYVHRYDLQMIHRCVTTMIRIPRQIKSATVQERVCYTTEETNVSKKLKITFSSVETNNSCRFRKWPRPGQNKMSVLNASTAVLAKTTAALGERHLKKRVTAKWDIFNNLYLCWVTSLFSSSYLSKGYALSLKQSYRYK